MQGIQEGIGTRDTPISDYREDTPASGHILRHTSPRQFGETREISRLAGSLEMTCVGTKKTHLGEVGALRRGGFR